MPELPEVEIYRRYFEDRALGQRIARVEVRDERILGETRKDAFARRLRGSEFIEARRHGKHLFASTKKEWLHLHFGMSGDLAYYRKRSEEPRWARVVFHFAGGAALAFEDMRMFGKAELIDSPEDYIAAHKLGPDPLDREFTLKRFETLMLPRRGAIKSLLMSQEVVAGLGNLYVDEVLYQTSIAPRRSADRITSPERRAMYTAIKRILRDVIARRERGGPVPAAYLTAHREVGDRCPRCGGTIRRTVVFGRTTYFCGKHQR